METVAEVLDRRILRLASVRATRVNREIWRMADDRYFHRLPDRDLAVVNHYLRRRDEVMSCWPGASASSLSWQPGTRRPHAPRLSATGWQWLGWLLSPRFPVR